MGSEMCIRDRFGARLQNFMTFRRKFWTWQPFFQSVSNFFQQGIFAHYDVSLLNRLIDSRKMWFSCSFSSNISVLKVSKRFENFKKFASAGAPVGLATPPGGGAPAAPGRTNFSKFSNRFETFRTDKFDENEQENHIFSRINEPIQ